VVEGIGAQILDEGGLALDVGLGHAELLGNDLLDAGLYVVHRLLQSFFRGFVRVEKRVILAYGGRDSAPCARASPCAFRRSRAGSRRSCRTQRASTGTARPGPRPRPFPGVRAARSRPVS